MNWLLWPMLLSNSSSATFWPTVITLSVFAASFFSIAMMADFLMPENSGSSSRWPWKVWTNAIFLPAAFSKDARRARAIRPALKVWEWMMSGLISATRASNSLKALWSEIGLMARPSDLMRCSFTFATLSSSASAPWTKPVAIDDSMPVFRSGSLSPASSMVRYLAVPPTFMRAIRCRTFNGGTLASLLILRSSIGASQKLHRLVRLNTDMARSAKVDKAGTDWASLLLGLGLGLTVAMEVSTLRASDYGDTYQIITLASRFAALIGTYLALVGVLLVARIPWVERGVGHDRLVIWHRKLAPYSLYLIGTHVLFVVLGIAGLEQIPLYKELWRMIFDYPWVVWGLIGFVLMVAAGVTSYKKARAKMTYETWWMIHVLTYGAIAASFMHQITNGTMFINHPLNQAYWIGLYAFVAFAIVVWRVGIPVAKSIRHNLKVDRVIVEAPGVISVIIRGRSLHALGAQGGQFFNWRFAQRGHFLLQHPYSLSAAPTDTFMRITVKDLGDHSHDLINLSSGIVTGKQIGRAHV